MFPDEEHILRVSYELDFQKEKDTANLKEGDRCVGRGNVQRDES